MSPRVDTPTLPAAATLPAGTALPAARRATVASAVLVGNPRPGSRTLAVARQVGKLLHEDIRAAGAPLAGGEVVDLAPLAADLAAWECTSPALRAADATVCGSSLLLVASPTFKAAYSGLLKLYLDRLPRHALRGVVVVPLMTAASAAHAFAVDACLRPVLVEMGATVPVSGLTVLESQFGSLDATTGAWRASVAPVLAAVLAS
jgi:FMN reductase